MSLESDRGMIYWQSKTEELGEKPVPVPLFPPQIPHGLTQARTRVSAVRGRRLTTWALARPFRLRVTWMKNVGNHRSTPRVTTSLLKTLRTPIERVVLMLCDLLKNCCRCSGVVTSMQFPKQTSGPYLWLCTLETRYSVRCDNYIMRSFVICPRLKIPLER
jgi:hypothetical protein